jgi:hypothetical protein
VFNLFSRQGKPNLNRAALAVICGLCGALSAGGAQAYGATVQPLSAVPSASHPYAACAPQPAGVASCQTVIVPAGARLDSMAATVAPADNGIDGTGLAPADLQAAYKLPSSTAGSGQTVALVDAYNDPTAESDLAAYRSAYGLPSCTTAGGCFDKVNQTGGKSYPPQPTAEQGGWPIEESLDLDMVSAICPNCHIMLVEANSASIEDLGAAVNEAVKLGATEVSNSYGSFEYEGETASDKDYTHPGVPITVASGDYEYDNEQYGAARPSYPASSPDVIAVGGTNLVEASNSRGWNETVWSRSGSGCSLFEPKPSYQTDSGCSKRTTNDVAAAAESISIYDTSGVQGETLGGWFTVGGTSAATPIIAAYEALSGSETRTEGAAAFYKHTSSFFPVTSGSNGSCKGSYLCTGGAGYRGPTGVGTPDGVISSSSSSPTLSVTSVSPSEGPTAGATAVTIKGSGFVKGASVEIGGKAGSVTVHSETEITAKTVAGSAGSDEVVVTDTNGTSSGGPSFTYVAPPKPAVSSVSPSEGTTLGGTSVTIKGSGFVSGSTVTIGARATSVDVVSATEITAKAPAEAAGSDEVVVTNKNGTSTGGPSFTFIAPPPPSVSAIDPAEGYTLGGTQVTITGTEFLSGSSVTIGGTKASAVKVISATEITAKTPAHAAGSAEVSVTNKAGTSSDGPSFSYLTTPKPAVSSIVPAEGSTSGGTLVTIKGSNFWAGTTVKIGSRALAVTVVSETEITAKTPSHAAGSQEVVVSAKNGSSAEGPAFTYHTPAPAATTALTIKCSGSERCLGTLELNTAASASVAHASAASARTPAALGTGAYSIAPGKSDTVKVTLNARGRSLLRSARRAVGVTLTVQASSATGDSEEPQADKNVRLDLIRRSHGSGGLERSAATPSGGLAAVTVSAV